MTLAYDKRKRRSEWCGIIIHHTTVGDRELEEINESLWRKLFKNIASWLSKKDKHYVSAHYIIGRYGEMQQLVDPEKYEAFHAGKSWYWHPYHRKYVSDWNRYAIGVELVGDGNKGPYSKEQYEMLALLCKTLMQKHPSIHPLCITGHEVIAPKRKNDPGRMFDWKMFFELLHFYRYNKNNVR